MLVEDHDSGFKLLKKVNCTLCCCRFEPSTIIHSYFFFKDQLASTNGAGSCVKRRGAAGGLCRRCGRAGRQRQQRHLQHWPLPPPPMPTLRRGLRAWCASDAPTWVAWCILVRNRVFMESSFYVTKLGVTRSLDINVANLQDRVGKEKILWPMEDL